MPASLCRASLVPLVLVIMIAALPAGAGADTIQRSFGNWKATFSGTFDDNVSGTVAGPGQEGRLPRCHPRRRRRARQGSEQRRDVAIRRRGERSAAVR